jgi:DHA2 family multidrug resistance protein-like MFS transporter
MAAALSETSTELGGALGIAILGSLVTAVYRSLMASMVSVDVPQAAADAARETLGAAAAVAASLSDPIGSALLGAAREAFTEAVVFAAAASATLTILAAIVTATVLRDISTK